MSRYIDADELMREVEKAENSMESHGQEFSYSFLSRSQEISTEWYYVEELIDHAPTVDAVEVVRCEYCVFGCDYNKKWYLPKREGWWCCKEEKEVEREDFCSWGERRDDAEVH